MPDAAHRAERRNCSSALKCADGDRFMGSPNTAGSALSLLGKGSRCQAGKYGTVLVCTDRASPLLELGDRDASRQRSRGRKRYLCGHVLMHTLTGTPAAASVPTSQPA